MLTPAGIIARKRDGKELTSEQIAWFIRGLSTGDVADYQASAFLMAVFFRGMNLAETVALTEAMVDSGERYDLKAVQGTKVDKHSTGGVGDKVSLVLAPLAAACGLKVPMISGRGLGHTGGTLDKLESIEGFDVMPGPARFAELLGGVGCAMAGQSERMVPADRKLYALRDVTGTVECVPLIVASILSKKLAEGANALVLDVKTGNGAFMKSRDSARHLARALVQTARKMGLPCRAVLTDMSQPLGYSVGNALEMVEAIDLLRGCGSPSKGRSDGCSSDLKELTIQLCAHMLELGGATHGLTQGRKLAHAKLADGSAWRTFVGMVGAQGGRVDQINDVSRLPRAPVATAWVARERGYIGRIDTAEIGRVLVELGGGRKRAGDPVDPAVGLVFHRKLGSRVKPGDPIVTVHSRESAPLRELEEAFHGALEISGTRKPVPKLISEVIGQKVG